MDCQGKLDEYILVAEATFLETAAVSCIFKSDHASAHTSPL